MKWMQEATVLHDYRRRWVLAVKLCFLRVITWREALTVWYYIENVINDMNSGVLQTSNLENAGGCNLAWWYKA